MIPCRPVFASPALVLVLLVLGQTPARGQSDPAYYVDISRCMEEARPARKADCYAELETLLRDLRSARAQVPPAPATPANPATPATPAVPATPPVPGFRRPDAAWPLTEPLGLWVEAPGGERVFLLLEAGH